MLNKESKNMQKEERIKEEINKNKFKKKWEFLKISFLC